MAENDIYNSKRKYEKAIAGLEQFVLPPEKRGNYKVKYYCMNSENLRYFYTLFAHFDAKDISYVRRNRLLGTFRLICHATTLDLRLCGTDCVISFLFAENARFHTLYCAREIDKVPSEQNNDNFVINLVVISVTWRFL